MVHLLSHLQNRAQICKLQNFPIDKTVRTRFPIQFTTPQPHVTLCYKARKQKFILLYEREYYAAEEKEVVVFIVRGFESRFQIEESTLVARVFGAENDSPKKVPTQTPSCSLYSDGKLYLAASLAPLHQLHVAHARCNT